MNANGIRCRQGSHYARGTHLRFRMTVGFGAIGIIAFSIIQSLWEIFRFNALGEKETCSKADAGFHRCQETKSP